MDRELRKHPRVPTNQSCSLRRNHRGHRTKATTFCVATHGLGLWLVEPDAGMYGVGEDITVSIPVEDELTELTGRIAWTQRGSNQTLNVGIHFAANPIVAPSSYLQWVETLYTSLRERSMALGGDLAFQRKISLRTYQDVLDRQARDGGYLREHLQRLGSI